MNGRLVDGVVVYDHSFKGDRAWFRFAFKWTDPKTGEPRSRAGIQSYRIEDGKLVETWIMLQPLGSVWPDAAAQEHWRSPPPPSSDLAVNAVLGGRLLISRSRDT